MDLRILAFTFLLVVIAKAIDKCDSPIEIAAVVDVSDNLPPSDLPEINNFLKKVANIFHVSNHASHMSVILAGTEVREAIDLQGLGANRNKFLNAVDNFVLRLGGAWSLDKGLRLVKEKVFTIGNGVRNFLPRVVLVITNGRLSDGKRSVLQRSANDLYDMGAHVYAVGIGNGVSRNELALMVKDESEYLYQIEGFKDLDALAANISKDICQRHDLDYLAVCKTKVDIGFIVDSSGSISDAGYLNIKNFMKGISVAMGFKPGRTHIGVVLYSQTAEVWSKFGKHANFRKLFRILTRMPHWQDLTRIDLGLHVANTELFTTEAGMREDIQKIAVLFTDGEQTTENVTDLIPLEVASRRLRERGIVVFAVGIGKSVNRQQLLDIAGNEKRVIMLRSFSELQQSVNRIALSTCQQVGGLPVINFTQSVYYVNEDKRLIIGLSVTKNRVIAPVTVSIHPHPATAGNDDFSTTVQNVTFMPSESQKQIEIELVDDLQVEPTESFVLSLVSPSAVILGEPSSVNIIDNDVPPPPVINFTQPVYTASENGNAVVGISVTDGKVTEPITIRITPTSDSANWEDYDGAVKEVTFQPGETGTKVIYIDLVDDSLVEPTEKFTVSLSSGSRAILGRPSTVYIRDDDVFPVINFTRPAYTASEGDNAIVEILVTDGKVTEPVTVSVTPRPGTAHENEFDVSVKNVTFEAGEMGPKRVKIYLNKDYQDEITEKFTVHLSSYSRAILGGPSTVYVKDGKEIRVGFTKALYSVKEGEKTVEAQLVVKSGEITYPVTITVEPSRGSAGLNDFHKKPVKVTFQQGEKGPKTISFDVIDDSDDEKNERFKLSLSSEDTVGLDEPSYVEIIDDDDPPLPVIKFTQPVYNASESDNAVVGISVISGKVIEPITVSIISNTKTASANDFEGVVKEVTFQPGQTGPKFVEINLVDDSDDEATEEFTVSLSSNARVVLLGDSSVMIQDNDEPICKTDKHDCHKFAICKDTGIGLFECTCKKGFSGNGKTCEVIAFGFTSLFYDFKEDEKANVGIKITRGELSDPVTIEVKTFKKTADEKDFIPVTTQVTFQPGDAKNKIVGIDLIDDDEVEPTEEFIVRLSSLTRVGFGPEARVRIKDNDARAQICNMDLGVLIDSTGSMRDCNFQKEKEFVNELAGYFQVGPRGTRISSIVYGTDSKLVQKFNETQSLEDFRTEIDKLPLDGGRANLDKAMQLAASTMFSVKNGMRPNVPKVLVVLNDGAQKIITQSAKEISSMLRMNEVRVIVIGVGEAERDLLSQIVATPEDLIIAERFEDAKEQTFAVLKRLCLKRDNGSCRVLKKEVDDLKIGGCVSETPVEIGVCGGYCSSFSNFVKKNGFYEMECGCCKAKTKVTITVDLKCSMNTYQAFSIRSAKSCSCESCEENIINVQ